MSNCLPRYPVYIPSKGRADRCAAAKFLGQDGVPFFLVVEPQEEAVYADRHGAACVLTLPWDNPGSVIPARNWIKDHATAAGHARHWQLDDNVRAIRRRAPEGRRIPMHAGVALRAVEDLVDRYENVAVAGLNYQMFMPPCSLQAAFTLNCRIYSCSLVLNALPYRWRGRYNEDTDLCLQVLAGGWCTVLVNAFMIDKPQTMKVKGGNTDTLYQGDGRLRMARALERLWPGVVVTKRRFQRPQHHIIDSWKRFDTPLKLKPGIDLAAIPPNDYGLKLKAVGEVKSENLKRLLAEESPLS
jgi:hypothetical protein